MSKNKKDIFIILLGNTLLALGVILFIVPGHLITGGTTGIALFFNHYFHLPIAFFTFIFNFIMFLLGGIVLGKRFALTTLLSTFYYPIILGVFEIVFKDISIIDDIFINTLFAGVLVGISIAISQDNETDEARNVEEKRLSLLDKLMNWIKNKRI